MPIDAGDINSAAESARQEAAVEFAEKIKARRAAGAGSTVDAGSNPDRAVLDAGVDAGAGSPPPSDTEASTEIDRESGRKPGKILTREEIDLLLNYIGAPLPPDTETPRETPAEVYDRIYNEVDRNFIRITRILKKVDLNDKDLDDAENTLELIGRNLERVTPDLLEKAGPFPSDHITYLRNGLYYGPKEQIRKARERLAAKRAGGAGGSEGAAARGAGGETEEQKRIRLEGERTEANRLGRELGEQIQAGVQEINVILQSQYTLDDLNVADRKLASARNAFKRTIEERLMERAGISEDRRRNIQLETETEFQELEDKIKFAREKLSGTGDTSPPGDTRTEKEKRQDVAQKLAEVKEDESYLRQILGETEITKVEFVHCYERFQYRIGEMASLELTEPEVKKLAEYKQKLADYKIQAIQRGIIGATDLSEARGAIVIAQKRVENAQRIGHGLLKWVGGKSRAKVNEELAIAQAEYQRCVREAKFLDCAQINAEKIKLEEAKIEAYRKERGLVHKAIDWNKRLSGFSAERLVSQEWKDKHKWGTKALKMVNGRTVVSVGLLGASTALTLGGNVVLGLGLGTARAAWSFAGSGLGTYGLMTGVREGWKNKTTAKEIETMDAEKIEENISSIQARAALDGRELKDNSLYAQLLVKREKFATEKGVATPEEIEAELKKLFGPVDKGFLEQMKKERHFEMIAAGVSLAVASVSAGIILRRASNAYELKQAADASDQINALRGVSKGADVVLPKPPLESHQIIKPPYVETPQGVPSQNISAEGVVTEAPEPEAGAAQEAVPTGTEPIAQGTTLRAGVEVNVTPSGVTETPITAVEAPPSDTVVGSGLAETSPTGVGKIINHLEIRPGSGASIDIGEAGDAVVHAGKRGIEGALLDMRDADPDRYTKMLAKLQEHYHTGDSGKAENLIHRFVLDNSDGKDLNRVLSADVHIDAQGNLTLGKVDLMPPVHHAADVATEASPPSGAGISETVQSPSGAGAASEAVEHVKIPDSLKGAADYFNPSDKASRAKELLRNVDFSDSDVSEAVTMSPAEAMQHAKEVAAESILSPEKVSGKVAKLSDALHLMLGREESKAFLKTLGIKSGKALNEIQNHTFAWLVKEKNHNPFSAHKFDVLIDTIKELKETKGWDWRAVNSMPLKKVFLELAKEARK